MSRIRVKCVLSMTNVRGDGWQCYGDPSVDSSASLSRRYVRYVSALLPVVILVGALEPLWIQVPS